MIDSTRIGKRMLMIFFMMLVLLTTVSAISVAPAMKMIQYSEGATESVRLRILNPESKDFSVLIFAKGDLAGAVEIENSIVTIAANEPEKHIYYKVNMAQGLEPGPNEADIYVVELPDNQADSIALTDDGETIVSSGKKLSTVSTKAGVISKVRVNVPYPGKYIRSGLDVRGSSFGKPVEFILPTYNLGSERINEIWAEIDILGPTNDKLAQIQTQRVLLDSHADVNLRANWNNVPNPGTYFAVAHVIYDGEVREYKGAFIVGETVIDVKNVSIDPFSLGDTAKINVSVQSRWNEILPGVFADFTFFDSEGVKVGDFKSAAVDLKPFLPEIIRAYWETEGLIEGNYVMQMDLHSNGNVETVKIDLHVAPDKISTGLGTGQVVGDAVGFVIDRNTILISLVIIFAIMNISLVVFVNRKLKGKGGMPPQGIYMQPPQQQIQNYQSQQPQQQSPQQNSQTSLQQSQIQSAGTQMDMMNMLQQQQLQQQVDHHLENDHDTSHTLEQLERLEKLQQGRGGFNG